MKKNILFLLLATILITSCSKEENNENPNSVTLKFSHFWDATTVTKADFNTIKFTNENGEKVSLERYRYLLSNIYLLSKKSNNRITLGDYLLIDLGEEQNLSSTTQKEIPIGEYSLHFTFGFKDADNIDGVYNDLNSANFNVPGMLGGGYHYMQFDGKYTSGSTSSASGFNYHAIRAVDRTDPSNLKFKDTSFDVILDNINIDQNNNTVTVKMNIAEWFKNPEKWDLNILNQKLMPNYDAQILMNKNGKSVFGL